MNRSKKLSVLLGVLAVVCVVTFGVSRYEERQENIKNSDEIILELDGDSVTALSWKNETASLSFHKAEPENETDTEDGAEAESVWLYDGDEAFPADSEKIGDFLGRFSELGAAFIIEDAEDFGQYGLDDPICTIDITTTQELPELASTKDEETGAWTYEILLGDFSKMDSQRYVSIGDGNVYLVQNDPLDDFGAELKDMIKNDETPSISAASAIRFELEGGEAWSADYDEESKGSYNEDDMYFAEAGDETVPLDTDLVNDYLSAVSGLYLGDYVTYNATDAELASYGLDAPELTVSIDYTSEDEKDEEAAGTFVLHISRDPEEKAKAEKKAEKEAADEDEEFTAYARVGDSQIVYLLLKDDYETLIKGSLNDLRHQNLFYGSFEDIYQLDFSLDGEDYAITSDGNGEDRVYLYGEDEIDAEDLKTAVTGLAATEFTDETADGKEEIRVKLYLDDENFPEIEIALYRYDGETCLAEVDGKPMAKIARSDAVALIEAVNAIVL